MMDQVRFWLHLCCRSDATRKAVLRKTARLNAMPTRGCVLHIGKISGVVVEASGNDVTLEEWWTDNAQSFEETLDKLTAEGWEAITTGGKDE